MNSREAWVQAAREFAIDWAKRNGVVTSDDVRKHFIAPPDYVDNRIFGSVFRTPLLKPVGQISTRVPTSKGRRIRVFVLS